MSCSALTTQPASLWPTTPIGPHNVSAIALSCCLHVGQMAISFVEIREFEKERRGGPGQPAHKGTTAGGAGYTANAELTMAAWRGDIEVVERLDAEVTRLTSEVDDPQTQNSIRDIRLNVALANDEARTGIFSSRQATRGVDLGRSLRNDRSSTFHRSPSRRCGSLRRFDPSVRAAPPTFQRLLHDVPDPRPCRPRWPVDTREIDAIIARRKGWGSVADVVRFSVIAAPSTAPDKRAQYLSTARSIATERGWHGILRLIDSHLS